MTGQPEATRMGEALTIEQRHIGPTAEPGEGLEQQRALAKREQTGHIRETWMTGGGGGLDHGAVGHGHEDHRRPCPAPISAIGKVGSGHEAQAPRPARQPHAAAETLLDAPRLRHRGQPPAADTLAES